MPAKSPSAKTLFEALKTSFGGPTELDEPRPLEQIVLLILANRSDIRKARTAMRRIESEYVDWNEVRVTSAYELSRWLRPLGAKKAQAKAEQVKELLSTVYNRFNKLNLDFLHKEARGPAEARKRERFQTYLQDRSIALHVMMSLHGSDRQEVIVTSGLPRVLQRLGVLNGKTNTVTATRSKLKDLYEDDQLIAVQWGFYALIESYCHARNPDCPDCPALKLCPAGQKEAKKRLADQKKAAKKAAEKARALAKREAAAAKKAAAAAKKAAAAEKKRAAAAAKKEAAKTAAAKKAAAKKAAAKKAAKKKKTASRKPVRKTAKKPARKTAKKATKKKKTTRRPSKAKPSRKKPVSRKRSAPKRKTTKKKPTGRKGKSTSRRR